MAKKATKTKKASKRPAKKAAKKSTAAATREDAIASASFAILYRQGAVLRSWIIGEPVTQIMRDAMEKAVPPITASERMALEAKRRLHEELAGSIATAGESAPAPAPAERRRQTAAELLGAPAATEIEGTANRDPEPVKAVRERPQLI